MIAVPNTPKERERETPIRHLHFKENDETSSVPLITCWLLVLLTSCDAGGKHRLPLTRKLLGPFFLTLRSFKHQKISCIFNSEFILISLWYKSSYFSTEMRQQYEVGSNMTACVSLCQFLLNSSHSRTAAVKQWTRLSVLSPLVANRRTYHTCISFFRLISDLYLNAHFRHTCDTQWKFCFGSLNEWVGVCVLM